MSEVTLYTLHDMPYTLDPSAYTLHLTPCTLHPARFTQQPIPHTLQIGPASERGGVERWRAQSPAPGDYA